MTDHSKVQQFLYKNILKQIAFLFDPGVVHEGFVSFGELAGRLKIGKAFVSAMYGYRGADISRVVDGITYKTPVLLSAGFDYNARLVSILNHMGFGGEEVGSITAKPCKGNAGTQLTRAKKSESIIVYKGLKNDGVEKIIARLKSKQIDKDFVVGVSIARTNSECAADDAAGIEDYATSFRRLNEENIGQYYTINISCPNAFGGESFADPKRLPKLLEKLREIQCSKPVYVKMPINVPWEQFKELIDIIRQYNLQGVVIGNLNKNYADLDVRAEAPEAYRGGLSGKPCRELSNSLIENTRNYVGNDFTIIGVGGIFTPEHAIDKMKRGANLVQLITGMIFEGPQLIRDICYRVAQEKI